MMTANKGHLANEWSWEHGISSYMDRESSMNIPCFPHLPL